MSTHNIMFLWRNKENEPAPDKTNKMECEPSKDGD